MDGRSKIQHVVGVIQDFHFMDLSQIIEPLMIRLNPARIDALAVRLSPGNTQDQVEQIRRAWTKIVPHSVFDFYFLNDSLNIQYRSQQNFGRLLTHSSFLAIFIACLGLFGMAAFTSLQRTKEIGIRKVLGASRRGIVFLLGRDVGRLILASNIVAWPLAYFGIRIWLRNFAYRTSAGPEIFFASALLVLSVGFLTVLYHSLKAAASDPVTTLKYE
jgi:putative ABC transport system permease protein